MIVKEDLIKRIRAAFDLNIYEVKIWASLLGRGVATAGELADISNVPRSRSYDVLEGLEKKGFVIMKLGKPIKYIAVNPDEIMKRLAEQIQEKAENKISFLNDIKSDEIFSELDLLYKQGIKKIEPYSLAGAFKGRDNIYGHLKSMLERAGKSVTIVSTTQGLQRKLKRYKNLLNELSQKGVKVRVAGPINGQFIKELNNVKNFAQVKNLDSINARFVIIDDKEILFMISDDKDVHESYDTAVWVDTPFFTKAFVNMFNNTWQDLETVNIKNKK